MSWTEFYKGRLLSQGYRDYAARRYTPFLAEIVSTIKSGDRVVEVGCGLATMTSILADKAVREWACQGPFRNKPLAIPFCGFRCFDLSQDMVTLARQNLFEGYPVEVGDARLPTGVYPDIVHSHGMLEHMTDEDIRAVIAASRKDGARTAIHYVPGDKYETPSFGDERLLPLTEWQRIAAPTKAFTFNDGYDYVLRWDF